MATEQFILLPREGLRAVRYDALQALQSLPFATSTEAPVDASLPIGPGTSLRILDTSRPGGPQLVEMDAAAAQVINYRPGPLRALPVTVLNAPEPIEQSDPFPPRRPSRQGPLTPFVIECVEARTGRPLTDVRVFVMGGGAIDVGTTDQVGKATLNIPGTQLEQVRVYTPPTHWGAYRRNVRITPGNVLRIEIELVSLPFTDAVKRFYSRSLFHAVTGVTVGVIDTGIGPHSDLNVVGGMNTVAGEPSSQWEDWKGHGTHVAGLIGAFPSLNAGVRGLAPGVPLRSYRVFGQNSNHSTNYAVLKALILAATQDCDIINLSLGGGPPDVAVQEAIQDARDNGMLVVVAAGNGNRKPVVFPAAYPGATAVSALGAVGCFPSGSVCEAEDVRPPRATSQDEFIAGFSNCGPEIAATAPGVGVISTLPNNRYGPYSGTSMAAPVVAGAAACLLSRNPHIYVMPRNRYRSDALEGLVRGACRARGFGSLFEGHGLPDPAVV
jgi:subtilisin family serine protease